MKNKKVIGVTVASALCLALCGGALVGCGEDPKPKKLTDSPLDATKIVNFETGEAADREAVFATNGFENGGVFNTFWKTANVSYSDSMAELSISEMATKEQVWNQAYDAEEAANNPDYDVPDHVPCQADYYGGEIRTSEYYGYGDYEVCMKPSNVYGTVSTFFVCTGSYDVPYGEEEGNPHDEVDIEFLGKDTTRVQFNYFANEDTGHEYMYDLGFDASEEFHTYGFRWTSEYIVWFVDGKPVYKVNAKKNKPMPNTAGRILCNYWTGTEELNNWSGAFSKDYSGRAQYKYIATSAEALPDPTKPPELPPVEAEVPEDGWTEISTAPFDGWGTYTVTKESGLNISHDGITENWAYKCCGMDLASDYSWVKFTIANNADVDAVVRLDLKNKSLNTQGIEAVVSEYEGAKFNSTDKALVLNIAAGDTADIACKIDDEVVIDQLVLFLNSTNGATEETGDITITGLMGIVAEENEEPPVDPVEIAKVSIGENVTFTSDIYDLTTSEDKTSLTLAYTDLSGKSYANVYGNIADIIGESNTVTFTLTNNGDETAKIRMDVKCPEKAVYDTANGNYCNLKATYEGEIVASGNDYQYGGADWVQIAADETVTVTIKFKAGVGADSLMFYADSSTFNDEGTHTGNITISDITLWKA